MAVQVMYPNKSLPIYTHPLNPSQHLTHLPNSSSINYHTLSQSFNNGKSKSTTSITNTNPHTSRCAQKLHGIPFKSNPSFAPFIPHQQQQQLAFDNTQSKVNIPLKSSTISLAEFASDIEKEITNKVLKKLQLNQNNPNNILMVAMCKFVDDITGNINDNMMNLRNEFKEPLNILLKQHQQQQIVPENKLNNYLFQKSIDTLQNQQLGNKKAIDYVLNQQQQQFNNINNKLNELVNNIKQQNMKHQKSFDVLIKQQQQQQQLQINLAQKIKKITNLNIQQNKKIDVVQNQIKLMNKQIKNGNNKIQQINNKLLQYIESYESSSLSSSVSIQSLRFGVQKLQDTLNNIKINEKQPLEIINNKSISNKYISDLKNKISQLNIKLKDMSSNINNFNGGILSVVGDVSSKINNNQQTVITQKVIMNNINKIKKDLDEFNIKKQLNHLCVKFNKLESSYKYLVQTFNESNAITKYGELNVIGLIDDYISLHNDFDKVYDERITYHTQLIKIENIITENNTQNNIMKDKIMECINIKENECNYLILLSNNCVKYKINKNIAMLSDLLKTLYEGDKKSKSIFIPRLSGDDLKLYIHYMEFKYINKDIDINFHEGLEESLERYRNVAKYLGIKPLINVMDYVIQLVEEDA